MSRRKLSWWQTLALMSEEDEFVLDSLKVGLLLDCLNAEVMLHFAELEYEKTVFALDFS